MSASNYLQLDDFCLAQGVEAGDPAARSEVHRRFNPVAVLLARRVCARIAHRGQRCPGLGCELAFLWVLLDLLDRFAGREPDGTGRGRSALIVAWSRRAGRTDQFAAYVLGPAGDGLRGMVTEGRRAWNRARGLRVRVHPSRGMMRRGAAAYAALVAGPELAAPARLLGLDHGAAIWEWLEALFLDACETGLEDPIDFARVARYLLGHDPGEAAVRALAPIALAVDDLLAANWPAWYDEYLSRPRQHTRRGLRLTVLGDTAGP
jgi:hypothetical protein